jgi:hypothetical protein
MPKRNFLIPVAAALSALVPITNAAAKAESSVPTAVLEAKSTPAFLNAGLDGRGANTEKGGNLFEFVIERGDLGDVFAGHRSHSSHRSHASHRSHYSSR